MQLIYKHFTFLTLSSSFTSSLPLSLGEFQEGVGVGGMSLWEEY
jgi:hypothetical protein